MSTRYFRCDKGLAPIFIVGALVLLAAVVGAMWKGGKSSNMLTSTKSSQATATTVVDQGGVIRAGFDGVISNGTAVTAITWDTGSSGIFNQSIGGIPQQIPDQNALVTKTNNWVYKKDGSGNAVVKIKGIGVDATADYVVALGDLTQSVCQQINQVIFGSTTIPAPATGTLANWTTAATALDLSADNAVNGKDMACIQTTDTKYVYYQVVLEQ